MQLDEYRRIAEAETSHWWYRTTRALLGQMLGPHLREGGRFLDAGCGPGATGSWLSEHGTVTGVDFEPLALELYREARPKASLAVGSIASLPFADGSFDAVLCVTVLYHDAVADPVAAVSELGRVLRPGGTLCLMEPGIRRLRRAHDREVHTARRFSRADLGNLMTAAGLELLRCTGAYSFLAPPALVKAALERGRSASDLGTSPSGGGGVLERAAALERRHLTRHDLPWGLSVLAVGRRSR